MAEQTKGEVDMQEDWSEDGDDRRMTPQEEQQEEETECIQEWEKKIRNRGWDKENMNIEAVWKKEIQKEANEYWRDTRKRVVYMMAKFGERERRTKVKCATPLSRTPRWIRGENDAFEELDSFNIAVNRYECLTRAIAYVTADEMEIAMTERNEIQVSATPEEEGGETEEEMAERINQGGWDTTGTATTDTQPAPASARIVWDASSQPAKPHQTAKDTIMQDTETPPPPSQETIEACVEAVEKIREEREIASTEMDTDLEMNEEEWHRLTGEAMREQGYQGQVEEARTAVKNQVEKEKAKRKRNAHDEGEAPGTERPKTNGVRVLANGKRGIAREAIRGLMASKYANADTDPIEAKKHQEREVERREAEEKGREQRREKGKGKAGECTPPGLTLATLHGMLRTALKRIDELEKEVGKLRRSAPIRPHQQSQQHHRPPPPQQQRFPHQHRAPPRTREAENSTKEPQTGQQDTTQRQQPGKSVWKKPSEEELKEQRATRAIERTEREKRMMDEEEARGKEARGIVEIIPDSQEQVITASPEEIRKVVTEAGIEETSIEGIQVVNGRIRVKVKEGEESAAAAKANTSGLQARVLEKWAGLVLFDMEVAEWNKENGMKELRAHIEKKWGFKLMKEPRWLANPRGWEKTPEKASVVIHVARAEDRQAILNRKRTVTTEGGYLVTEELPEMRPFQQARRAIEKKFEGRKGQREVRCNTCTKRGHMWWACPDMKNKGNHRCGLCAKTGHTSFWHPCATRGCDIHGRCRRHESTEKNLRKCAECGGRHEAEKHEDKEDIRVEV